LAPTSRLFLYHCFAGCAAYAFAELIDNALAATANNDGTREIDIRLVRWHCLQCFDAVGWAAGRASSL